MRCEYNQEGVRNKDLDSGNHGFLRDTTLKIT